MSVFQVGYAEVNINPTLGIAISGYYGVPVLDLFRTCSMQPSMPLVQELFMPDGLHPNDAGHRRLADRLIGFLKAL